MGWHHEDDFSVQGQWPGLPYRGQRRLYHHIRCEGSCLASEKKCGMGAQGHSCHFCAELSLPHKRKRVPELDQDLKVEIFSPVQCNYEEFLRNTNEQLYGNWGEKSISKSNWGRLGKQRETPPQLCCSYFYKPQLIQNIPRGADIVF